MSRRSANSELEIGPRPSYASEQPRRLEHEASSEFRIPTSPSAATAIAGFAARKFLGPGRRRRRACSALAALLRPGRLAAGRRVALAPSGRSIAAATNPLAPHAGNFPAKAKSVIWLFMNGGPSQVDTWDYKPELAKRDGKELAGFDKNTGFFTDQVGPLMKSPFKFQQHGQSGTWVSEIFPEHGHSTSTTWRSFTPATRTRTTIRRPCSRSTPGMSRMGFPCVGSWVTYGLGTENQNLPAFVVMYDTLGRGLAQGARAELGRWVLAGRVPGHCARMPKEPRSTIWPAARNMTDQQQRAAARPAQPAQSPASGATSARCGTGRADRKLRAGLSHADGRARGAGHRVRRPRPTQKLYGLDNPKCAHFAKQVLIARRLVERGRAVRADL